MEVKHTPGPWDAQGMVVVALWADSVIHLPAYSENRSSDELRANARLIAAAPELLDALKNLRAMVIGEHGVSAYENINGERAEAAIAKAEGK